jgi:hypothetical protein
VEALVRKQGHRNFLALWNWKFIAVSTEAPSSSILKEISILSHSASQYGVSHGLYLKKCQLIFILSVLLLCSKIRYIESAVVLFVYHSVFGTVVLYIDGDFEVVVENALVPIGKRSLGGCQSWSGYDSEGKKIRY